MSFSDPKNPYSSPRPGEAPAAAALSFEPIRGIDYLRMYTYVFENPNWLTNLLLCTLCSIIPVIGPLLVLGYSFDIVDSLLYSRGARYVDFNFNRFSDYLLRGVWPFLVQLVVSFVIVPILLLVVFAVLMVLGLIGNALGDKLDNVAAAVIIPLLMILYFGAILGSIVLTFPLILRAGIAQDFTEGFNISWATDFIKKNWLEVLLGFLFLMVSGPIVMLAGFIALCVGIFVAMPLVMLAQAHMYYQLYLLFLSRGGQPVPQRALAYTS
jgi:hypothetical protein